MMKKSFSRLVTLGVFSALVIYGFNVKAEHNCNCKENKAIKVHDHADHKHADGCGHMAKDEMGHKVYDHGKDHMHHEHEGHYHESHK